jgi:prepilin-type N-terminal cleavage/methylation domain-containing protein
MINTRRRSRRRARRGFTLVEMIVSIMVMSVVTAAAITFYRFQVRAIRSGTGRLESVQNLRYVENIIDRELRLAGGVSGQPLIVMAHPMAVVFNVNLVTRAAGDRSAVYYNPNADSLGTEALDSSRARQLPLVGKVYPTQNYSDASGNRSGAETIAYFLRPDPGSGRNDIYTLFRRVNDRDSTVVARDLQVPADTAYFFRYWRTDATGTLSLVPNASLPIYWDNAGHVADSLRVVDLRINTWYHDASSANIIRGVQASTKLLNAGLLQQNTCGSAPLPATNVTAALTLDASGTPAYVHLAWNASLEETGGEKDVALYMIQRRATGSTGDWATLANLPANASATYTYDDRALASGSWSWAIVAQDCSPSNSALALSGSVTIP